MDFHGRTTAHISCLTFHASSSAKHEGCNHIKKDKQAQTKKFLVMVNLRCRARNDVMHRY